MPVLPSRAGAETSQFLHLVCAAGSPHKNLVPDPWTEWSSCSFPCCESASGESNNRWQLSVRAIKWANMAGKCTVVCITFTELVLVEDYSTILGFIAAELQIFPTVDRVVSIYQFIWEVLKSLGKVCKWYTLKIHCVLPLWFTTWDALALDNPNAV